MDSRLLPRLAPRGPRSPRAPFAAALVAVLLLLAGLLTALVPSAQAATPAATARAGTAASLAASVAGSVSTLPRVAPSRDYPHMPRHCATPQEKIPQKPVICHLDPFVRSHPTIVLWGDSHAWMMIPALRAAAKGKGINLVATVMGGCPPMDPALSPGQPAASCDASNQGAIDYVQGLVDDGNDVSVLLGGSWQRYWHALTVHDRKSYEGQQAVRMKRETPRLFRTLAAMPVPVAVDGQVATVPMHRPACKKGDEPYSCDLPKHAALAQASGTKHWLFGLMKALPGKPHAIDVNGAMCTSSVCHGLVDGVHTWFDDLHISASRSRTMAPYFAPLVKAVLAAGSDPGTGTGGTGGGGGGGCTLVILCP
jgi:hypothetical protein